MVVDVSPERADKTVETTTTTRERGFGDYLRPLSKHILLIGLLVLLALVVGIMVVALTFGSSSYEGTALILFKPNADSQLSLSGSPQFSDITPDTTRQQSAVLLMNSMDIAKEVQKEAATNSNSSIAALASEDPLDLRNSVRVQTQGNFVSVKASASTPAVATWLANNWADLGVARVNTTYAQPSANVDEAVQQAKAQLDADQKALEDFIAHSQIVTLTAQLSQTNAFIGSAITSNANSSLVLYDAEQQSTRDQISNNYAFSAGLDQQLNQIEALRTRVQQSPEDQASLYANQVSLLLLLNSMITGMPASTSTSSSRSNSPSGQSPGQAPVQASAPASAPAVQLQISLADAGNAPLSKSNQLSDIDAAIKAIQGLQEEIGGQTADLEKKLLAPAPTIMPDQSSALSPSLQSYIARQSQLRSRLEQETANQDQLQKTRDLDRSTYELLRTRLAEQKANSTISDVVTIGSAADEEETAGSRSLWRSLAVGTLLWVAVALVLGVGLACLLSIVWPEFDSNTAITRKSGSPAGARKLV